jgi:hypothetical protein
MHPGARAILYLDDIEAGSVEVQRIGRAWIHGRFMPAPGFETFAPLFGRWSLLMHADVGGEKLSPAASEELRSCECEIDRMQARLLFPETNQWITCAQINIDGPMIEWKSY